jgi:pimeloyl-ACP methyl ester carboxylesterase
MPGWCAIRRQSAAVRTALRLLAAVVAMPVTALHAQRPPAHPRTYVIVHGAWGGGWDWRAVDSMLTRRGNRVVRVTLTGLGERSHLASPEIGLSTHIDDVVNTILWESLHDVILVGHSYGGMVITGTADRIPERIHRLVYLDAILPDSGETLIAWSDALGATFIRANVRDGFVVPGWVTDTLAIPRDVAHPFKAFTDTLRLVNPDRRSVPMTYVLTFEPTASPDPFQRFADRAADRGWPVHRLRADHTPERSARGPLVTLLVGVP